MRWRDLTGHDQLDAAEQRLSGTRRAVQARIEIHQNAPLRLFCRNTTSGFEDARSNIGPLPVVRHDLRLWLCSEGVTEHQPQRFQPQLPKFVQVEPAGVLAAWPFAFARARWRLNCHGWYLPLSAILT